MKLTSSQSRIHNASANVSAVQKNRQSNEVDVLPKGMEVQSAKMFIY